MWVGVTPAPSGKAHVPSAYSFLFQLDLESWKTSPPIGYWFNQKKKKKTRKHRAFFQLNIKLAIYTRDEKIKRKHRKTHTKKKKSCIKGHDLGAEGGIRRLGRNGLGLERHPSLHGNTDTLKHRQNACTGDGTVSGLLPATSHGQHATGEETGNDGVERVLGAADGLDGTVERWENTTPDTKVATDCRRPDLDGAEGAGAALTVGRVAEALETVPNGATNDTHGESTAEITENHNRTGVSWMIRCHCLCMYVLMGYVALLMLLEDRSEKWVRSERSRWNKKFFWEKKN